MSSYSIKPDDRSPHRTIYGILNPRSTTTLQKNSRVQIGSKFDNPIPEGSAKEAQKNGPWQSQEKYPGVPWNKFTWEQGEAMENTHDWIMQNVYETREGSHKYISTYVGWNSTASYAQLYAEFEKEHESFIENLKIREVFMRAIQKSGTPEIKKSADRHLSMKKKLLNTPEHMFWVYEDLTYFHSKIHLDYGLAPISYVCLREDMVAPPKFLYTTFNIVEGSAYQAIANGKATKTYRQIQKIAKKTKPKEQMANPCEAGDKCRCNMVFHILYAKGQQERKTSRINMIPNNKSILDVSNFNQLQMRIVVECSNACSCSIRCPRRRLQQGQTKRLVVFYENEVLRFGLRTAETIRKGEFICEYTGVVLVPGEDGNRDCSYDAGLKMMRCGKRNDQFVVIDSSKIGNIARFMSHACKPNAALIETHSRVLETDTLIPRISVYALQDINIGDPVTICYYQMEQLQSGEGVPCGCRPGCPNHLPMD